MAKDRKKYNDPSINHVETETWLRIRQRLTTIKILCEDGATNAQIAEYLGVSIYTIVTYRQRYPEFDECFRVGRDTVIRKLEGKLYQKAMGVVNNNIVKEVVTETTEEVEDAETGDVTEVVHTKRKRMNIRENGQGDPDQKSLEFMLKNLAPDRWNVQPTEANGGIEPIQLVDNIPQEVGLEEQPKLFYDDSQDEDESEDE